MPTCFLILNKICSNTTLISNFNKPGNFLTEKFV